MSHGFDRAYTRTLPTFRDRQKPGKRKPWWEMGYYVQNPEAAKRRRVFEKLRKQGLEKDFSEVMAELHGYK